MKKLEKDEVIVENEKKEVKVAKQEENENKPKVK